jgi:hypothetical protein
LGRGSESVNAGTVGLAALLRWLAHGPPRHTVVYHNNSEEDSAKQLESRVGELGQHDTLNVTMVQV